MRPSTARLHRALSDLAPTIYRDTLPLTNGRMLTLGTGVAPQETPIPAADALGWVPAGVGSRWGGQDENAWFHAEAAVPPAWASLAADGQRNVVLRWVLGLGTPNAFGWPEGLLYVNGALYQGINKHHPDVLLGLDDVAAGALTFDARAWSGMLPNDHRIEAADIALLDRPTEQLYYLLKAGRDLLLKLDENDPTLFALAEALDEAYDHVDMRQPRSEAFYTSTAAALATLRARLAGLRERYAPAGRPSVVAIGHGHLDVAWLWQTRHTREKTARTFSIADALMQHYPEYVFLHTTPQVYAWLKTDYPELYERVRRRVREGRFEAAGAMWLEADTNLVSGESLVRQILYGQRFLREEFDQSYTEVLWLPDVFGYTAALPQIMLRAGIKTFMTTKMSWNDTNDIPADTFRWRGIDGSEVLTHFITTPSGDTMYPLDRTETYNGDVTAHTVRGIWNRYAQKDLNDELLLAFGYGDGGAGPSRQLLEQGRALQQLPGLPALSFGRADEYFARLHERVWERPDLPTWDGELYFEYHRGTYTTQARLKHAHRQNEAKLLLAEYLDAWRWARDARHAPDVSATLDDAWRTLLLHEFHDILPGSSLHWVYDDAKVAMDALAETLDALVRDATRGILADGSATDATDASATVPVVLNPSPWARGALVALPAAVAKAALGDDAAARTQPTEADGRDEVLVRVAEVPARGYVALAASMADTGGGAEPFEPARGGEGWLENGWFRVEFGVQGEIVSLVDKRVPGGRELFRPGAPGNVLELFEDRPRDFEAWDINDYYQRKPYDTGSAEVRLVEAGPLRATMRVTRNVLDSTITQDISLYSDEPRLDFRTRILWHDAQLLLKAAFPLDLRTREVTREIQYGALAVPTHRNTSWDQARFEFPAHRWVDLSEPGYGVSLLNDSRYGHDAHDATLRLTLLRSPRWPDPDADQGEHVFTYSLYPHLGDWRTGGTVQAAYALNRPPIVQSLPSLPGAGGSLPGLVTAEPANVVVEAVKRAADGDGLIVRLYEAYGSRVEAVVRLTLPVAEVIECDLLERPLAPDTSPTYAAWAASPAASHTPPVATADGWRCELRPFEVRTFRVRLGG